MHSFPLSDDKNPNPLENAWRRLEAWRGAAGEGIRRLGGWAKDQILQDVPRELAECEFECREARCCGRGHAKCTLHPAARREDPAYFVQIHSGRAGLQVDVVVMAVEMTPAGKR